MRRKMLTSFTPRALAGMIVVGHPALHDKRNKQCLTSTTAGTASSYRCHVNPRAGAGRRETG